jgi:hypothetical protein
VKSPKPAKRQIQEKRQVLFRIRLAAFDVLRDWGCYYADTGKDSAREIREYFYQTSATGKTVAERFVACKSITSGIEGRRSVYLCCVDATRSTNSE